jgi:hypothetical protein
MIALMIEASSTSESSVNFYQTAWRNIPENSYLKISFGSDNDKNAMLWWKVT